MFYEAATRLSGFVSAVLLDGAGLASYVGVSTDERFVVGSSGLVAFFKNGSRNQVSWGF